MFKLGVTGTIASGKSTASRILSGLGAVVIDADAVAREVVAPHTKGAKLLRERYGDEYFFEGDVLDRRKLGALVFSDKSAMEALNAINRPLILSAIEEKLESTERKAPYAVVVVDAALLFEYGMDGEFDEVWLITATDEQRIARMTSRDGLTIAEAKSRIQSQLPEGEKRRRCTRVIDNSGPPEETREQIHSALGDALVSMNIRRRPCSTAQKRIN